MAATFDEVVEGYHLAAREFSKGTADRVKALFSHRDDVTLANPFGPAAHGWKEVSEALEFAAIAVRGWRGHQLRERRHVLDAGPRVGLRGREVEGKGRWS